MKIYAFLAAGAATALLAAAPSGAHLIHVKATADHSSVGRLKATIHYQQANLAHSRGAVVWIERVAAGRRLDSRESGPVLTAFERQELHWHRVWTRILAHELARTRAKLRAATAPAPAVDYSLAVPYAKWACIHSREGSWTANTGNGYYGGLQMDYGFMQTYGADFMRRWGTANNWPPWAQITAAERAYRTRGFSPWPNTARACGQL